MKTMRGRQGFGGLSMLMVAVMSGVVFFAAGVSRAVIIVSDGFSGTDGDAINGRTPDGANLPGGAWYSVGFGNPPPDPANNPFAPAPPTISGNTALLTTNTSAFISIQDSGGYTKPAQFIISGDLKVGTISGNSLGVGLGFNSVNNQFVLAQEINLGANGDLNFAGSTMLIGHYNPADFGDSPFDPNSFYHLAYTVNTSTGGVSDITLSNGSGSQGYTLSTSAFTAANTAYAGIFSNSDANDTSGNVDNFLITTIPEPASLSLLAGASLLLLRRRKHG